MDTGREDAPMDDRPVVYHDMRLNKQVGIDPRIIDAYLSVIGFEGLGLLMYHYRMAHLPEGTKRTAGKKRIKSAGRVGLEKLNYLNQMLIDLGFIHQVTPDVARQSRHIASHTYLLDPPAQPSAEMIEKYREAGYESLQGSFYQLPSLDPTRKPAVKPGTYLGTRSKSGYPDRYPVDEPGTQIGTRNGQTGYLSGYPIVHSLTHKESPEDMIVSECTAPVMSSKEDAIRAVKMRLLLALQERGWMGSGWTWSDAECDTVVTNLEFLSQDAIAFAVEQWMDTLHKGKRREPFHPSRSLNWLIQVCKNYTPGSVPGKAFNGNNHSKRALIAGTPPAPVTTPSNGDDDFSFGFTVYAAPMLGVPRAKEGVVA